jgi:hypothetical protein
VVDVLDVVVVGASVVVVVGASVVVVGRVVDDVVVEVVVGVPATGKSLVSLSPSLPDPQTWPGLWGPILARIEIDSGASTAVVSTQSYVPAGTPWDALQLALDPPTSSTNRSKSPLSAAIRTGIVVSAPRTRADTVSSGSTSTRPMHNWSPGSVVGPAQAGPATSPMPAATHAAIRTMSPLAACGKAPEAGAPCGF